MLDALAGPMMDGLDTFIQQTYHKNSWSTTAKYLPLVRLNYTRIIVNDDLRKIELLVIYGHR